MARQAVFTGSFRGGCRNYAVHVGRGNNAAFCARGAGLSARAGRPPEPFVVTAAMAAVVTFLTPIGNHGNLSVYGPGRYRLETL